MDKIALVFPGQGAQYVGMGESFYNNYLICRQTYEEASDISGVDVAKLCFKSSLGTLSKMNNMQLAVTTTCVAIARAYFYEYGMTPQFCAGHSVGEISAFITSGAVRFSDGIKILMKRGELLEDVYKQNIGTMLIAEEVDYKTVESLIEDSKLNKDVYISCESSHNQILLSGTNEGIEIMQEKLLDSDARITPLITSTPMHCPLMGSIQKKFYDYLLEFEYYPFRIPVITNLHGRPFSDPELIPEVMSKHLTHPVQWKNIIECMDKYGVSIALEMGPKNLVTNLIENIAPEMTAYCFGKKMDRKYFHENFLGDENYKKDIPEFMSRCLGIAVATQNANTSNENYQKGVVDNYNNIKKLHKDITDSHRKILKTDMEMAIQYLENILKAKNVPERERRSWIKQLLDETSNYYLLEEYYA
ncbi:ACP S-malonyltransferase [Vallitalea guaymasensis]|uniref:ACP S-malonyltransferase n=1 Tax=Vallitalea guaymasensis TaxID=1185412 RepID=UPI00187D2FC1|nr:acyltransferase domain-containing protein [Vallitalea guaymasensis]